ncbi:MAG: hypothetical protein WC544_04365 [Patescibacteria group bacterium]
MRQTIEQSIPSQAEVGGVSIREMDTFTHRLEKLPDHMKEALGPEEREMLRQVNEKDPITFEHSLAVARIVDTEWPAFSNDLKREGISYKDMARAAALHDVGKVALPDCILKSTLEDQQLADIFFQFVREQPDLATEIMRQKGRLSEKRTIDDVSRDALERMDHRDVLPLNFLYRNDPGAMAEIVQCGLDPHQTFMDALRTHEHKSRDFISRSSLSDREVVAALAGSHHNYNADAEVKYPRGSEMLTLSVTASELLHLSDVFQAMTGHRLYQKPLTESQALEEILQMADQGLFHKEVANRWVAEYKKRLS